MPPIRLTDEQKQRVGFIYAEYPEYSDIIDQAIVGVGFEAFDPYEYAPIDLAAEGEAFGEGAKEGLTLGLTESKPVPAAGDVDIPLLGEMQPSRLAGNIAGSLLPMGLLYKGAGIAAKGLGLTKKAKDAAGIAIEVADKDKKLSMGGKAFQVVSAEAVPGALVGWVQSDGDIDEMIKMAGIFTAAGLLLEGTATLAIRGWKKVRKGQTPSADEKSAMQEHARVIKEQAEESGIPTDIDSREQNANQGITFKDVAKRLPGLSKWFDTEKAETIGRAIVNDETRLAVVSAFKQSFLPDGTRPSIDEGKSALHEVLHNGVDNIKQHNAVRDGIDAIEKAYEEFQLTTPEQGEELLDMYLHGEIDLGRLKEIIAQDLPAAQALSDIDYQGTAGAEKAVWSPNAFNDLVTKIHKKAIRNPTDALRDKGGRYDQRVSNRPASEDQRARLVDLLTDMNKTLVREQSPEIASDITAKILDPSLSMAKARQMETLLRAEHYKLNLVLRERAHASILAEDVDPLRIQELEVENSTKGWRAAYGRTRGWQSEKSFKENVKEIREALVKERTRFKVDPEGKYWRKDDEGPGRISRTKEKVLDVFDDLGLPWFLKVVPPYSRWGLGSNPLTKQGVEYGLNMFEEIGRLKMDWIGRYQKIVEPLNAGAKTQAAAAIGREGAKRAVEEEIRKKNLLVQALNGENTNEILKENSDLVPIYNQIRSLLDEAGMHIGIGFDKAGYLKDYFPHIFDGTTGAYRARRLSMEIGKRIGKVTKFLDGDKVDSIPTLKYFGSLQARSIGAEGYNRDLDAVIYTYLSGAAEMPFFNKFLKMSKGVQDRLPDFGPDKSPMRIKGQYANWVNYVVGKPSDWKKTWANWWKNNDLFNRNIDHLVELIGDAETKGLMTLLRGQTVGKGVPRKGGFTFSKEQETQAIDWFNRLIRDAEGETAAGKIKGMTMKKHRARLALKIDDIRAGLSNPHARPVVLESMYRSMVIAKLGLSMSHAVVNLTQTLVDAMPLLGVNGVARGVSRYVGNKQAKFSNGETVEDVLNDSGILSDIPEAREFTPSKGLGFLSDLEETLMFPARMSEDFNRGVAFLGKYEKNLADGLEHAAAVIDARRFVQKTHFPFNRAGTIPLFHSPGARFLLMFKSYALHQMNFSAELLENAIVDGDVGPLAKHLLAYGALGSAASLAAGGGASNLPLQVGHPLEDFTPTNLANRGVLKTVGGPPADMVLDILHGNYMSAIESYDYTAFKRLREAHKEEEPSKALMTGLGFR